MASNQHYATWEKVVTIAREATFRTAPASGYRRVLTTAAPSINLGHTIPEGAGDFGRGIANRLKGEFFEGIQNPEAQLECISDDLKLAEILNGLFQQNNKTGAGPYTYDYAVYSDQPGTNLGLTIREIIKPGAVNDNSKQITGNIPREVTISSEMGQTARVRISTVGGTGTVENSAADADGGVWEGAFRHAHWNLVYQHGDSGGALTAYQPFAVELTITNTAIPFHGTSKTPNEHILGTFAITGSIVLTRRQAMAEYDKFTGLTSRELMLEYGTAAAAGYFMANFDVLWGVPEEQDRDGIQAISFPFTAAQDQTTPDFQVVSDANIT